VTRAWQQIDEVLAAHCPATFRQLGRPATSEQIARLESSLGLSLPGDLAASLKIHNGMRNNSTRQFSAIEYDHLLTCSEMARDCKMLRKIVHDLEPLGALHAEGRAVCGGRIRDRHWCDRWIKTTDFNGDGFVVDLDPGPRGQRGQVYRYYNSEPPRKVLAVSWGEFLELYAARLKKGQFEIQDDMLLLKRPLL
jgi:cell wall assembly regulator SMI1